MLTTQVEDLRSQAEDQQTQADELRTNLGEANGRATALEQQLQDTHAATATVTAQLSGELLALQTQLLQWQEACADAEEACASQETVIETLRQEAAGEAAAALAAGAAAAVEQACVIEGLRQVCHTLSLSLHAEFGCCIADAGHLIRSLFRHLIWLTCHITHLQSHQIVLAYLWELT